MRTSMRERPRAVSVEVTDEVLSVALEDGRTLSVPLEWFPRLRDAKPPERSNHHLIGYGIGIHWPDLDEDISVHGLLLGNAARVPAYDPDSDDTDSAPQTNGSGDGLGPYRQ